MTSVAMPRTARNQDRASADVVDRAVKSNLRVRLAAIKHDRRPMPATGADKIVFVHRACRFAARV